MNGENAALNSSAVDPQTPNRPAFQKLFGVGLIGWLVGTSILLVGSWALVDSDSLPSAFMWTISHWWIPFAFGLLLLVGYGLVRKLPIGRAALAYILPVAVLSAVTALCLAVYPDSGFQLELLTYFPLVILFYCVGFLWMIIGPATDSSAFARPVIPALVGGLIVLSLVAIPAFKSDAFRYRDAFHFTLSKTILRDGGILSEGIIEIRKPGHFEFATPRYAWGEMTTDETEPGIDIGTITWGAAGAPGAGKVGSFPLQIAWRKGAISGDATALPKYDNYVYLQVRNADEDHREIYHLIAPIEAN